MTKFPMDKLKFNYRDTKKKDKYKKKKWISLSRKEGEEF